MTLQIDSLAISADEADTQDVQLDQLHEQIVALDSDILGAIERRSELARTLAAATGDTGETTTATFDSLGSDGSVISRMLARIASATR
ncbi:MULTISPECIES: hypothetical protein [Nocardiaceae]|uniref:hypothetical protein n=1 Tax=Nocardiaceae TaxID=85025 RepID=UPI001E4F9A8C|nr:MULTISPECIES: hypothetical protein [Rhodococcus]MCC8930569.1 hypothetical protein [Rhodococcus sp. I2R]MCZ4277378.1 hypothetical protein [Rhodococcus yunnanensis]